MLKTSSHKSLYLTKPQARMLLVSPHWYVGIFSRGTGKTTRLIALRAIQTARAVPGGLSVFYNATYVGAQQRTVASTISGWRELGWREGIDFVKNQAPPKSFKQNTTFNPLTWKNTIATKYGHVFIIASNDRPGLVNSLSITGGIFVDECRFIDEETMRNDLYPAIRGQNYWGKYNPYVFSRTYTTDMPMIGEDMTWLEDISKKMNPEQIELIAQAAMLVEELKQEIQEKTVLFHETTDYETKVKLMKRINTKTIELTEREEYANKIRMYYQKKRFPSVYFDYGSFFSNIGILGKEYFFSNYNPKNKLLARTSFLNIKPDAVLNKFYSSLQNKHFVKGIFNYNAIEDLGIADFDGSFQINSTHILDCNPNMELEIEFDYGDMCTCSVSQTHGLEERYIATFDVLLPESIDELVKKVCNFFRYHSHKKIIIYRDVSSNWMQNRAKQTFGPQTIELFKQNGWIVEDRTGIVNPSHDAKHRLINLILKETYAYLPHIRIIRETNMQLEQSLKRAPRIVQFSRNGEKLILKDKRSEKLIDLQDKPMNTTDHSDHFDYKLWHKYSHLLPSESVFS